MRSRERRMPIIPQRRDGAYRETRGYLELAHRTTTQKVSYVAIAFEPGVALSAALPHAEPIVAVPGAGHAANLQCPALVNDAVQSFLRRQLGV
jgi:pimeloyl-ACP methyl ester carboxylesterase